MPIFLSTPTNILSTIEVGQDDSIAIEVPPSVGGPVCGPPGTQNDPANGPVGQETRGPVGTQNLLQEELA